MLALLAEWLLLMQLIWITTKREGERSKNAPVERRVLCLVCWVLSRQRVLQLSILSVHSSLSRVCPLWSVERRVWCFLCNCVVFGLFHVFAVFRVFTVCKAEVDRRRREGQVVDTATWSSTDVRVAGHRSWFHSTAGGHTCRSVIWKLLLVTLSLSLADEGEECYFVYAWHWQCTMYKCAECTDSPVLLWERKRGRGERASVRTVVLCKWQREKIGLLSNWNAVHIFSLNQSPILSPD